MRPDRPRQPPSPHLGLRKPPGHTILSLLLHRLDPEELQEALLRVFPGADLGEVLVVDGKHLRGSGKGKSPQVRLVEVLALHLLTTLAQAKAEGREDQALLELLDRLGAEGLKGKVVVGDVGYLYPQLAGKVVRKGTGEARRTVSYALTGLGPEVADARRLGELLLSRWEVENRSFWVRDVLLHEDACQVRGVGAQVLAALRAFLVSLLHRQGVREKKAALEAFSFNPLAALRFLGLYAV